MTRSLLALTVAAALSAGCNLFQDSSTSPSGTNNTATESFSGSLTAGGSGVFMFTVAQSGTVTVALTTLSTAGPVGLGIGTPSGTTNCQLTSSSPSVTAASSPQISATENAGAYCVEVFDVGSVTTTSTFGVTIVHP